MAEHAAYPNNFTTPSGRKTEANAENGNAS